jgi:hypothetical protein
LPSEPGSVVLCWQKTAKTENRPLLACQYSAGRSLFLLFFFGFPRPRFSEVLSSLLFFFFSGSALLNRATLDLIRTYPYPFQSAAGRLLELWATGLVFLLTVDTCLRTYLHLSTLACACAPWLPFLVLFFRRTSCRHHFSIGSRRPEVKNKNGAHLFSSFLRSRL